MSAFVEKKTGLEGNRTLIQSGFLAWCNVGSIFEQDISEPKLPLERGKATWRGEFRSYRIETGYTRQRFGLLRARDTVYQKSSNVSHSGTPELLQLLNSSPSVSRTG